MAKRKYRWNMKKIKMKRLWASFTPEERAARLLKMKQGIQRRWAIKKGKLPNTGVPDTFAPIHLNGSAKKVTISITME